MNKTKKLVLSALFLAIGILIPYIFHATGIGGSIFLPMHIPVLIAGFFIGPLYALVVGFLTPIISGILTGMPPFAPLPMALIMAFELGAYGFLSGLFYEKLKLNMILCLILAMIGGRIIAGLMVLVLTIVFGFAQLSPWMFVWGGIVTSWPGIAIQLVFIPTLVFSLRKYTTNA